MCVCVLIIFVCFSYFMLCLSVVSKSCVVCPCCCCYYCYVCGLFVVVFVLCLSCVVWFSPVEGCKLVSSNEMWFPLVVCIILFRKKNGCLVIFYV